LDYQSNYLVTSNHKSYHFIHSFIPDISIAPLQVHYYYSEALPTTALILCRS